MNNLVIVGGGAAGLMAACTAAEHGISAILLERRHRPGLKLLLCGNNRCNLSHNDTAENMLYNYGQPVADFIREAVLQFSPEALRIWFEKAGLPTVIKRDDRIYPKGENSDDVLHCFLDFLREKQFPLTLNCPVHSIADKNGYFELTTENGLTLQAENVLVCTGGVSYPKTGSVGDGQRMASALGLKVTPLQPGLAGMHSSDAWLANGHESDIQDVVLNLVVDGEELAAIRGNVLCSGNILRGSAIFDASRIIARRNLRSFSLYLDLFPNLSPRGLSAELEHDSAQAVLQQQGIPAELAAPLAKTLRGHKNLQGELKHLKVNVTGIRPLKEAIVTVGGVALTEINPATMESIRHPGLYFAGEVMDVDGPTGGYNLHCAFATGRLAVNSIAAKYGKHCGTPSPKTARGKTYRTPNARFSEAKPLSPKQRYSDPRSFRR